VGMVIKATEIKDITIKDTAGVTAVVTAVNTAVNLVKDINCFNFLTRFPCDWLIRISVRKMEHFRVMLFWLNVFFFLNHLKNKPKIFEKC
jgi:hypothetical protein